MVLLVAAAVIPACGSPATPSACSLLGRGEAAALLGAAPSKTYDLGATCGYLTSTSLGLFVQVQPPDSTGNAVPYISQPGSHLVTVKGVNASWRLSTSPTTMSILAFRRDGNIYQVSLLPADAKPQVTAEQAMVILLREV